MDYQGKYYDSESGIDYDVKSQDIKKCFTNGFAQTVYELEDGTIIYVSYSQDRIQVMTPSNK